MWNGICRWGKAGRGQEGVRNGGGGCVGIGGGGGGQGAKWQKIDTRTIGLAAETRERH